MVQDFRNLSVWQRAHQLALEIYLCTRAFPREELFGLTSQLRRSAYSLPGNIAEGCGRGGSKDFVRFLRIALGSACELDYGLLLARDLGYLSQEKQAMFESTIDEVEKMLSGLINSIQNR